MVVFDIDATTEGVDRKSLAEGWKKSIVSAIEQYRKEHSMNWILKGVLKTLVATVFLILAIFLVNRLYHKAVAKLVGWIEEKHVSVHIQSFEVVETSRVAALLEGTFKIVRFLLVFCLLYGYLHIVLKFFPWTSSYAHEMLGFMISPFQLIGAKVWMHLPNLFFVAAIALLSFLVIRLLRILFNEIEKGTITISGFYPEWSEPSYRICRTLVSVIGLIMAFPYIPGSSSPAFKGISIFMGLLLSLGSTSAIANILAGYSLIYRRAFKVGDRVKIADFTGVVTQIRLEVTHLQTIKNEEIVVPNSLITGNHVINYSTLAKEKGLILHTNVTIGYDTPWRQVHALLLLAAERTPGLMREPAAFVLQKSLDDYYVAYELNVYCDKPLEMPWIYSDLHKSIQDAFNEFGVQIMSPSYRSDPAQPKIVPRDQWYAHPAQPPESERSAET